ncbi:MAG: hypothetical protein DI533_20260 [Cereibacter sphaeroides]|uniref:Uncharacterized protein n=1 Tax=Cereibacter sphaeroides TaxID=1063 RepID=A0A2W5THN6_CERSP|nr:MAG: hypothetical protein DI533_20260 [Cereibacter sphaeroides]
MTVVKLEDCVALGYCARAMRPWFNTHGLDYYAFVAEGLDEETLLALDDDFATKAVEQARKREAANG